MAALPPLIRALLRRSAYPHPVDRVELIQTHVSFVFLAGDYVYKIKKAVNFGFLDFSTLAKRRYYCRQEVLLNSRLCADTYLGVAKVRRDGESFSLTGRGPIAEYAVKMRRLPADRMMDRLLLAGRVSEEMIERLARRLVEFHSSAETSRRIAEYGDWAVRYAWEENFRQWAPNVGRTISAEQDRILRAYGEAFFARKAEVLRRRVDGLRIRDCHGDLRSDAVCFVEPPAPPRGPGRAAPKAGGLCIYDCIDFNRRLRYTDVAGDVGFLAMDLDYRGAAAMAGSFVEDYARAAGDRDLREIIDFYKCYRACVRGKVDGFRLSQPEVPAAERRAAQKAARRYFGLACSYAASLPPALLIITCGLAGTGKSTLARAVAEASGFALASSDVVRKRLAGLGPAERRLEEFGAGIYGGGYTERTYAAMLEEARPWLREGRSVILDASYIRRDHRRAAARLARETGAQFACVELRADEAEVRRRLAERLRRGADPSDARWETYVGQKRRFQRPSEVPAERRVIVDSAWPVARQVRTVLRALRGISPLSLPQR